MPQHNIGNNVQLFSLEWCRETACASIADNRHNCAPIVTWVCIWLIWRITIICAKQWREKPAHQILRMANNTHCTIPHVALLQFIIFHSKILQFHKCNNRLTIRMTYLLLYTSAFNNTQPDDTHPIRYNTRYRCSLTSCLELIGEGGEAVDEMLWSPPSRRKLGHPSHKKIVYRVIASTNKFRCQRYFEACLWNIELLTEKKTILK